MMFLTVICFSMVYLRLLVAVSLVLSILIYNSVLCAPLTMSSFTPPNTGDFIRLSRQYHSPLANAFFIPLFDIDTNNVDTSDLMNDGESQKVRFK